MSATVLILTALLSAGQPNLAPFRSGEDCVRNGVDLGAAGDAADQARCAAAWIYSFDNPQILDPLGADAERVFSRDAAALIRASDQDLGDPLQLTHGGPGAHVRLDPEASVTDDEITVLVNLIDRASDMSLSPGAPPPTMIQIRMTMVRQDDGWRIHDVFGPEDGWSLQGTLAE
ncbi:MAG: hypothetical protein J0L52_01110 [Caulobacterales bacterium]|nr:hypothetical protein [Caulobacterales bacterium]